MFYFCSIIANSLGSQVVEDCSNLSAFECKKQKWNISGDKLHGHWLGSDPDERHNELKSFLNEHFIFFVCICSFYTADISSTFILILSVFVVQNSCHQGSTFQHIWSKIADDCRMWQKFWTDWYKNKVQIFWEGHRFLWNLHCRFVLSNGQIFGGIFTKLRGLLRIHQL